MGKETESLEELELKQTLFGVYALGVWKSPLFKIKVSA